MAVAKGKIAIRLAKFVVRLIIVVLALHIYDKVNRYLDEKTLETSNVIKENSPHISQLDGKVTFKTLKSDAKSDIYNKTSNKAIHQNTEIYEIKNQVWKRSIVIPKNSRLLIYNRVPKCGSTIMNWVIAKLGNKLRFRVILHSWPLVKHFMPDSEQKQLRSNITKMAEKNKAIFIRHLHFMNFSTRLITPVYFNIIRHPVQRFISHYYYRRFGFDGGNGTSTWGRAMSNDKRFQTLDECVSKGPSECVNLEGITLLAFFCGQQPKCRNRTEWTLQTAMKNVMTYYSFIGISEDMRNSLRILENMFPSYFFGAPKLYDKAQGIAHRTKTSHKTLPTNETIQKLTEVLKYEIHFYKFVQNRFYKKLDSLNKKMEKSSHH